MSDIDACGNLQESLKEGMDLSASINRIRFDGLASGVYRRIAENIKSALEQAQLDVAQVDEVRYPPMPFPTEFC